MKKVLIFIFICFLFYASLIPVIDSKITNINDTTPPRTFVELKGLYWPPSESYYNDVKVTIYAIDDYGLGEIHYILYNREKIIQGYIVDFTVYHSGLNKIEYWGVDAAGNEETPHNFVEFWISYGPWIWVEIIAPEPGIYLFGNKLFSSEKIFLIGSFTIEATVKSHEDNVIEKVEFYLDDTLIGNDSKPPYSCYCDVKHSGEGEIKAIGICNDNNCMEDTLYIEYYKFFIRGRL